MKTVVLRSIGGVLVVLFSRHVGWPKKMTKKLTIGRILAAVFLCLLMASAAVARDLGTFGAVYDIVEKDALKELQEKAKSVDFSRAVDRSALVKRAKNFAPEDVKDTRMIGPARKDRTFLVDMTYSLRGTSKTRRETSYTPRVTPSTPSTMWSTRGLLSFSTGNARSTSAGLRSHPTPRMPR